MNFYTTYYKAFPRSFFYKLKSSLEHDNYYACTIELVKGSPSILLVASYLPIIIYDARLAFKKSLGIRSIRNFNFNDKTTIPLTPCLHLALASLSLHCMPECPRQFLKLMHYVLASV